MWRLRSFSVCPHVSLLLVRDNVCSDCVCVSMVQDERLVDRDCAVWRLHGEPTVLITLAHIFNHFAPLMVKHATVLLAETETFNVQSLCGISVLQLAPSSGGVLTLQHRSF